MSQDKQRISVIGAAGRIIRGLVSQPFQLPEETEDEESGTIYAQPLPTEMAIENDCPSLYPASGYLQDGIRFLKGRTIWAIDGGVLTWQFPNGLLLVGRAVVSRTSFSGYESVQRVFDVPVIPFVVYPPMQPDASAPMSVENLSRDYLQHVLGKLPLPSPREPNRGSTNYFADSEEFLASLPESYYAASAARRAALMQYVDQIRDAAETVALIYALRNAGAKDIVMRDGRIHGGAGFLTRLVKQQQDLEEGDKGNAIVREVIEAIRSAVDHGVRVLGIIKHPRSNYCTGWYTRNGVESAKYVASDALLYYRTIEPMPSERTQRMYGAGKRSCLWQICESGYGRSGVEQPVDVQRADGRELVHWFYQNTGCFFVKPKEGVLPIRVDFILHNNHYRSWFADNLSEQVYTLCTGSGSPLGLPQPIVIADGYAKVHRPELTRSIDGLIAQFESSTDDEDKRIAHELRAYLDIYYRGALQ
ncbi:MAG TPA: DNA double-strand break repair nuclease NurA [Pyrinomonadaceae bacterium]|nr:DNA double-strand break repair nuclease NurA [Pyrinomonadaceae bacterium]